MNKDILIIDNYDSFTYNLVQMAENLVKDNIRVVRNDQIEIEDIDSYSTLILSPGPGIPDEAGMLKAIISRYAPHKKILGVCLGLQAIGEVYGASLLNLDNVYHGVSTEMFQTENQSFLFDQLDKTFTAGRYHSWVIDKATLPNELEITCVDGAGEIMGIQHKKYNVSAVQFHPESILTPQGTIIMNNFLFNSAS